LKAFSNNIQSIIIVILIIVLLFLQLCGVGKNTTSNSNSNIIKSDTIIQFDTLIVEKTNYIPTWKTRTKTQWKTDTVLGKTDTLKILGDYFSKYFYLDTINLDSLGYVIVGDTITKNKILSRSINSQVIIPTTTITNIVLKNKIEFYVGLGIVGGVNQLNYIGGEVLLRTRKRTIYGLGLGIDQTLQPAISGRMYWKIGKK